MTHEEFLSLASKAGFSLHEDHYAIRTMLAIFAAYVAEAERETIAAEFDRRAVYADGSASEGYYEPDEPAQIVRARNNT